MYYAVLGTAQINQRERALLTGQISWELNTKMLPTVWQGLSQCSNLTHITIRFPSSRYQRPIATVPSMPNLKSIALYDIDPLCYADDVSVFFLEAKHLEDLKLIWSPRMRDAREPSVSMESFFGKLIAANRPLKIKRSVVKNLYTLHNQSCNSVFDMSTVEEITAINCTGGSGDDAGTAFLDRSWRLSKVHLMPKLKMLRTDKVSRQQYEFLRNFTGLERLYLIGSKRPSKKQDGIENGPASDPTPLPNSPASSTNSPSNGTITHNLKDEYLEAITTNHGKTLRHLLLMPQWRLSPDDIALIVRQCPNLEQLGIGVEYANFMNLRLLVPFLSKLRAIRLLDNPDDKSFSEKMKELDVDGRHEEKIGNECQHHDWKVQWMELGGLLFQVGKLKLQGRPEEGKQGGWRRSVWKRPLDAAKDVEIFRMDSLDVCME